MNDATSLRGAMQFLLQQDTGAWPSDFNGTKPMSLRELLAACQDPRLAEWKNPSHDRVENRAFSEEAQGIGSDDNHWFISANANDNREALYKLTWEFDRVAVLTTPFDPDATHIGALTVRDGWVYVAVQGPEGIWKTRTDFSQSIFLRYKKLPNDDDEMFAWCDLNPHNGLTYTCAFGKPTWLRAYRESDDLAIFNSHAMNALRFEGNNSVLIPVAETELVAVPSADISLIQPTDYRPLIRVQGACFTPHHKWLAVCDEDGAERIHCHSTITGAFLGHRLLLADTDESPFTRNELEAICVAPLVATSGRPIQVHVLELNNEVGSSDDFYLWHFSIPDAATL